VSQQQSAKEGAPPIGQGARKQPNNSSAGETSKAKQLSPSVTWIVENAGFVHEQLEALALAISAKDPSHQKTAATAALGLMAKETGVGVKELRPIFDKLFKEIQKEKTLHQPAMSEAAILAAMNGQEPEPTSRVTEDNLSADENKKKSDFLVALAEECHCLLFHNARKVAYAQVSVDGHAEIHPIKSRGFELWLRKIWLDKFSTGLTQNVVSDAISTLEAKAIFRGQTHEVHLRIAHQDGRIYVDLCDERWRIVEISNTGWRVLNESPLRFIRTEGMLALPEPVAGGDPREKLQKLRGLINAPTEDVWCMTVAFLLGAFSEGPFTTLVVQGEPGSSKTSLCAMVRRLIDPSECLLSSAPREERDIYIRAMNTYLPSYENLSIVPPWFSDAVCTLNTGNASSERKYHTNDGAEVFRKSKRPVMINGVDLALRTDLLNRAILLYLIQIDENRRMDEKQLLAKGAELLPIILGGLYDVLVGLLQRLPSVHLARKPRMSDFATWVTAAEPVLGWQAGTFMAHYAENMRTAIELSVESDSLATTIERLLFTEKYWEGTTRSLLSAHGGDKAPPDWPKTEKALASRLKLLAPHLRAAEIHYKRIRKGNERGYLLWKGSAQSPPVYFGIDDSDYRERHLVNQTPTTNRASESWHV